ncbi:hypothetical protein ACJMK2_009289 [Sinanodonta woodiana]|uniref:Protein FAN n=1 Tax=Sinanodonta woodiana TaxID=1069815 RepID=A0ABD3VDH0_SINWO
MTFLENDIAAQERFNLLLLEPGEIYFEDFSVYYYPQDISEDDDAFKKRQRGHLKICSKSIVFVPKESQHPLLKFPMKSIKNIEEKGGNLFSKIDLANKMLKIISDQFVEMKQKNIISPYLFRKEESREHVFSLNYVNVDDCLPQMCQLLRASTLPPADQNAMINAIVLSRQSRVKFNTSWLDDLYETIQHETQGDKITPLITNPGRIMLTNSRLYFQPFNNVDRFPVIKIKLKEVTRIIKRRFLLKQIGLEIFCKDGSTFPHLYLSLKSQQDRDVLYEKLIQQSDVMIEDPGPEDWTLRWQNGFVSNYEYLLYLNSLADRSFNDLTQYPVMPWVIQDYTSTTLDLNNPDTFRDLSKPIGALNEERLERIKERCQDMPEPKFLYGSHYSTPGFVLFYLARKAPEYVLCLQNGKFDQPDRMFNSIRETWENCLTGAADFKELIPEFYHGPADFLVNSGISNFGIRQDGRPVGDVELPPWASGPSDYVAKMSEALESDYVSLQIHNWIDLIFGYKQKGPAAMEANNVFYYLTYEGAVDLDSIIDKNERACLEVQIMEFGQIPKQLFTKPHPHRYGNRGIPRSLSSVSDSCVTQGSEIIRQKSTDVFEEDAKKITTRLSSLEDFCKMTLNRQYSLHKDVVTDVKLSPDGKCIFSVSRDSLLKMYSLEEQRQLRSVTMSCMALSSCQVMPDSKTIIVGSWDNNVYFYSVEFGRILDTLHAHDDAVSSIYWQTNTLLTSSWDSTVKIWEFSPPPSPNTFVSAENTGQLDHDSGVTHMTTDADCSFVITGTKDGQICVWDLANQYLVRQHHHHVGKINSVLLSPERHQLLSSAEDQYLRVMDFETGTEIFVKDVKDQIKCMKMMGNVLLTGTQSGNLQVWDIDKAQLVKEIDAHRDAVTCLHLIETGTILSGSADRTVCLWKPAST